MRSAHLPAALAALALAAAPAVAQDAAVKAVLAKHCVSCHGPEKQKGDLRLDDLSTDFSKADAREAWQKVRERVAAGTMPPPKQPRPTAAEAAALEGWVEAGVVRVELARRAAEGRAPIRRLNRAEYENTLRDLLGVPVEVKHLLPPDGLSHGFDTVSEALSVSPTHLQRYLDAAEVALDAAVARGPRPEAKTATYTLAESRDAGFIGKHWGKLPDGAVVIYGSGTYPFPHLDRVRVPVRGLYRVRLTGYAHQSKAAVPFALFSGNPYRGGDERLVGYREFRPGKAATTEEVLELDPDDHLRFLPYGLKAYNPWKKDPDHPDRYAGPGLAFVKAEVEGPLLDGWPSRGHQLLFGDLPLRAPGPPSKTPPRPGAKLDPTSDDPDADARKQLPVFLAQAFRRPVTAADAEPYLKLYAAERKLGATFREAVQAAAAAALCSPEFLYVRARPGRLDAHALAARLSYFLARTQPDAELRAAADAGTLTDPAALRAHTERLLKGPGAARFTADFLDSWLNLREIDFTSPDRALYPEFDEFLENSMVRETHAYFAELLTQNLPARAFVDAEFAMLNERLARHYDLPGVEGVAVRRVALPAGSVRGGFLGQGAVLKVSANGTNTSPVVRGVYVLERLLGTTPPPPPPGVPAVEPDVRGATTLRDLLAKHRSAENCTGCHRLIDPPGFALEEFDVTGRHRDRFRVVPAKGPGLRIDGEYVRYVHGPAVDAAGEFTDGRRFKNFTEFRALLAADPERLARCFVEKLLAFATGREAGPADRPEVSRILAAARPGGYRVRNLLHGVVQSELFVNK